MATSKSPGTYTRPSDVNAAYQAALAAQQSARQKEVTAKKEKDKKKKLQQQLTDAKNWEASTLAKKKAKEKQLAPVQQTLTNLQAAAISPSSPGGTTITSAEQLAINQYGGLYVAPLLTELKTLNKQYTDAVAARKSLEKQLGLSSPTTKKASDTLKKNVVSNTTTKKDTTTNQSSGSTNLQTFAGYNPIVYVYNAPMIKTAYLSPKGPQQGIKSLSDEITVTEDRFRTITTVTSILDESKSTLLARPIGAPKSIDKGEDLWIGSEYSSKGVIQMNTKFNSSVISGLGSGAKYDDQLYGFRFLYNPKEVSMTWGIAEGVNWEAVQTGLDKSTPITTGLLNSTISFSLLLNRMGDMQYLDEFGLKAGVENPYPNFALRWQRTLNQELADIYKRGTMYDLEYLFKTIMGINSTYSSRLNGETADKGWLQGLPVDLHLGDGLRYQVRIGSLDVNHTIFNDRMVPILSTVNITCHRFYDLAPKSTDGTEHRVPPRGAMIPE